MDLCEDAVYNRAMPELPEVETICRGLNKHLKTRRLASVELRRANLRFAFPKDFAHRLTGARIVRFTRRAKYLLADMRGRDNAAFIWLTHLGMTGRFNYSARGKNAAIYDNKNAEKHVHLRVLLEGGDQLDYIDPRRFGFMDIIVGAPENNKFLAKLGPEPLSDDFNEKMLEAALRHRQSPIKNALLDQRIVAGLGNIYVCEALFMAGISPRRKAATMGAVRIARLVPAIRAVLQAALKAGGTTINDFATPDGQAGYFQHNFQVYDRAGLPCAKRSCNATIERVAQAGRSSFFCPQCQR